MDLLKLEETFYTLLVNKFDNTLKTKYGVKFTAEIDKVTETNLPTVFVSYLPSNEVGNDLANDGIGGVNANFQIEVFSPKKSVAKEIISECVRVAKSLNFSLNALPYDDKQSGIYRYIIRCNRIVGSEDTL